MKKVLSFAVAFCMIFGCCGSVLAATEIDDVFGNEYVEFDANIDGKFNVKDLVRTKKYYANIPVTLNLNFTVPVASEAEMLVLMKKELLKR